jgi:hypothetical protein
MSLNSNLNMIILLFMGLATFASAHTWIEQMNVIAANGTFIGAPGYARGNVLRTNPSFSDTAMTNLIPPDGRSTGTEILSTDPMCMPSQQSQTQTAGSPRLQAAAGSFIALRYQENGHVTLPNNQPGKPANRGTVFVYGTTQPSSSDTLLAIHKVWNAAGTGGDKRGVLLSSQNFDDGQCYQVNSSPISQQRQQQFPHTADALMGVNMWCQQDIALPANAPSGQPYTLYWVWDWPTAAGVDPGLPNGKPEIYTTCMDVDITSSSGTSNNAAAGFIAGQDLNNAAVASEFAQINNPNAVAAPSEPANASGTGVAASVAGASTGVAATSQAAQPTVGASTQGVATSQAAQTGFGGGIGSGHSRTQTTFAFVTSSAQGEQPFTKISPPTLTITLAIVPGALTETFTQYASVTQTVFHTIYPSGFKKRSRESPRALLAGMGQKADGVIITVTQTVIASAAAPSSTSTSSSTSAKFELRGRGPRLLRW